MDTARCSLPSSVYRLSWALGALLLAVTAGVHRSSGAESRMSPPLNILPVPQHVVRQDGRFIVNAGFHEILAGVEDPRVARAAARLKTLWERRTGLQFRADARPVGGLSIEVGVVSGEVPRLGDREGYRLEVSSQAVRLSAESTWGVLRGLETLNHLLVQEGSEWYLPAVTVVDAPRFPWRGLLLDVCRHWQPMEVVKRNLDGMAAVKMNVLHFHLTEDQGFRVESKTHPELHLMGSKGQFYTQDEIREIVRYAADRGIRVVPEFDMPGHTTSWFVSHPELASAPGPYQLIAGYGVFDPVFDPTNEALYTLLDDFLGEMAALFPDEFLHIGGDENNGVQWTANAHIQDFIQKQDLKDLHGLHTYFNQRVAKILTRHGKRLVGWDEILNPDLPAGVVVQSWNGAEGLARIAAQGHFAILSHGYYIDLNYPASDHYANDPLPASTPLSPGQQRLVLGGEATMWAEWMTPEIIDTRIWPRAGAVAERLWSPREVNDVSDLYRRLPILETRLDEIGLRHKHWPRIGETGLSQDPEVIRALETLASLVEPVKEYRRGELQAGITQSTPLNELVDWARPESRVAREFEAALSDRLAQPGARDEAIALRLADRLRRWSEVGRLAAKANADLTAIPQGRKEIALRLAQLGRLGAEAVEALAGRRDVSEEWILEAGAALERASVLNPSAVEFPFQEALRRLLEAAMRTGRVSRQASP